jgi:hypothetical protein
VSHLMADGIRVCGKPDGHPGKHYSQATVQREIERCRTRRADPEYRERDKARKRTPEYRERENARSRERYAGDPEYRYRALVRSQRWDCANPDKAFLRHQRSGASRRLRRAKEAFPGIAELFEEGIS